MVHTRLKFILQFRCITNGQSQTHATAAIGSLYNASEVKDFDVLVHVEPLIHGDGRV